MSQTPEVRPRPVPKWAITAAQRALLAFGLGLTALLLANTLYLLTHRAADAYDRTLFAVTEYSLPVFYQVMVLAHTGMGLLIAVLGVGFVIWHLAPVWKRRKTHKIVSGVVAIAALIGLAATGLLIMTAAASRANAWVWWLHVGLALLFPAAYILHRVWSIRRPTNQSFTRFAGVTVGMAAVMVAVHFVTPRGPQLTEQALASAEEGRNRMPGSGAFRADSANYPADKFTPANHVPIESPFFPAAATTTTGLPMAASILLREHTNGEISNKDFDEFGFVVNSRIGAEGCQRCHADTTEQWAVSAHRFSSFNNPFYEASINLLREEGSRESEPVSAHLAHFGLGAEMTPLIRSQWCSSCHDPALMIPGQMTKPIDRTSAAAQAGLTCLACHNIDAIHNTTGNGAYNQADEQKSPYIFSETFYGVFAFLHDTALKARPAVHKAQMLKPFHKTSEFCSACHKVSLDVPVNSYRWFRGQNEYDNWHDSGIAHNAARTFYLPPNKRNCQDCHMPLEPAPLGDVAAKNGMVRSHRFIAANNALPFIRGDQETVDRVEAFLRDNKLRVDVWAVVQPAEGEKPARTAYAPALSQPVLPPQRPSLLEVVVRNLDVGHTFPGGTNDSNESWIELTVENEAGETILQSGYIQPDGHVDPLAHYFRVVMVNREGERIFRRDPHNFITMVYANVIGPGTARVVHYELKPPAELAGQTLKVRARLMWRKFDRRYTEFVYRHNPQGFKRFDKTPDLPVVEIAAGEAVLRVGEAGTTELTWTEPVIPDAQWQRMNDYGIGLLLEGNTRGASAAFAQVQQISPQRVDGFRNFARAARVEGNLDQAYAALREAEKIAPGDARTAYVWGQVLAEDGRYAEAVTAYRRVLAAFPGDRDTWRELMVSLYRDQQFEESLKAGDEVLKIDPEDRITYYHRMLALRALGRPAEAELAELAYQKYQIDEQAQVFTQKLRLNEPGDNLETQPIHVHSLAEPGAVAITATDHVGCTPVLGTQ